jgi:hypothetical protein
MRTLLLIIVLAIACIVGCRKSNEPKSEPQPAYPIGSTRFNDATPAEFHVLKIGMDEGTVLAAVGEPLLKNDLEPLGKMNSGPVGVRYTYRLDDQAGIVWIDFDMNKNVTGIFWRDRD